MNYEYRIILPRGRVKISVVFAHTDKRAEEKINKYYPNAENHVLVRMFKYV